MAPRKPESSAACAGVAKAIGAIAEHANARLRIERIAGPFRFSRGRLLVPF
jgi:hypothetical protein